MVFRPNGFPMVLIIQYRQEQISGDIVQFRRIPDLFGRGIHPLIPSHTMQRGGQVDNKNRA